MTLHELLDACVAAIAEGHGDLEVLAEGCDCYGDAISLALIDAYGGPKVLVARNHYDAEWPKREVEG